MTVCEVSDELNSAYECVYIVACGRGYQSGWYAAVKVERVGLVLGKERT